MRRVSDMLRTLWKNVKHLAHKSVRFSLVTILFSAAIFSTPISIQNSIDKAVHGKNISIINYSYAQFGGGNALGAGNAVNAGAGEQIVDTQLTEKAAAGVESDDSDSCSIFSFSGWMACLIDALEWIFMQICWLIFSITGFIFIAAGKIFDLSMLFSFSGTLFKSFTFIDSSWLIIRNLINSLFIFAVLYVAFKQLLSFGDYDSKGVKKALTGIIAAALLINFSLFFTKVAIDVSNLTSRTLYYSMRSTPAETGVTSYGPANSLAFGLNVISMLEDPGSNLGGKEESNSNLKLGLVYLGGSAVHIVAAISFFMMAFYFVARIAILIILMITSPVFFLTFIIKSKAVDKLKSQWVGTLTGQLTFPIIYLLLIFIVVNIVNSGLLIGSGSNGTFAEGVQGGSNGFAIIVNFSIVIILMLAAFKQAKGAAGMAATYGGKLAGLSGGAMFAAGAFAGRQSLGRLGGAVGKSDTVKAWTTSDSRFKRFVGDKVVGRGAKAMHEGTWDVRARPEFTGALGIAGVQAKEFGKPVTKTAKSEFSAEGRARIAAGKVNTYSNVEARVKEANRVIGSKINDKEYKEFRENLIKDIKEKNKDKPKEQERLIKALVGEETYRNKSDYDKDRAEITKAINKEEFKTTTKEITKEITEYTKIINEKDAEIKALGDVKGDPEKEGRKKELERQRNDAVANARAKLSEQKEVEVNGVMVKQPSLLEQFETKSKKAPKDAVRDLATADITVLQNQLSKAHLESIRDKLKDGEYLAEDEDRLNKMINEMRYDPNTKKEILNWITAEAIKGMQGFKLELNNDIKKALESIPVGGQMEQETKNDIQNKIRQITDKELEALKISQITHAEILSSISPAQIQRYAKKIYASNDEASKNELRAIADEIEQGNNTRNIPHRHHSQYVSALRGINPPRIPNQNQNRGQGRNTQNRTTGGIIP